LLVGMRLAQRADDLVLTLDRIDRLEPELRDALLAPALADRRVRRLAPEERAGALRVPGAALVVADPAGARGEERVANGIERLPRHEHDKLAVHVCPTAARGTAPAWRRSKCGPGRRPWSGTTAASRSRSTSTWSSSSRRSRTG